MEWLRTFGLLGRLQKLVEGQRARQHLGLALAQTVAPYLVAALPFPEQFLLTTTTVAVVLLAVLSVALAAVNLRFRRVHVIGA